jgi:hypothetical protein
MSNTRTFERTDAKVIRITRDAEGNPLTSDVKEPKRDRAEARASVYLARTSGGVIEGPNMRQAPVLCRLGLHFWHSDYTDQGWHYEQCARCRKRRATLSAEGAARVDFTWLTHTGEVRR